MHETMKVAEYDRYGGADVIVIRERSVPAPARGEVLVRVRAAALNPKDVLIRAGKFPHFAGRTFPKRVGYDWSGEAVSIGEGVKGIAVGDALFGMIQAWGAGACAEYVVVSRSELAPKPKKLSFEEAAAVPLAALTALQSLRDLGRIRKGDRVLVNGASGGVGSYAVQLAKHFGAHVTTATSSANYAMMRDLGADEMLDHAVDDIEQARPPVDIFFDAYGNRSFARVRSVLKPRGTYVTTVPSPRAVLDHVVTSLAKQRSRLVVVRSRTKDLELLARLADEGAIRPVIERAFRLTEIADAHRALETRRTRGKLVVRMG